jgi:hypothetical protein
VAIGLAVERGGRAWGFPAPDSDYDCRFVYIRPLAHYLTPWARRDVIGLSLVDEIEVNGWDLVKSLKLLMKGNGVIIEWLTSPLGYRGDKALCECALRTILRRELRNLRTKNLRVKSPTQMTGLDPSCHRSSPPVAVSKTMQRVLRTGSRATSPRLQGGRNEAGRVGEVDSPGGAVSMVILPTAGATLVIASMPFLARFKVTCCQGTFRSVSAGSS